ncbi:MAG: hypothetical protein AB7K09_08050 [Planctomycetota bacterium]
MYDHQPPPPPPSPGYPPPYPQSPQGYPPPLPGHGQWQPPDEDRGWHTLRTALIVQAFAIIAMVVAWIAMYASMIQMMLPAINAMQATPGQPPNPAALINAIGQSNMESIGRLMMVVGLVSLGAGLAYIISFGMYLAVPLSTGLRGRARAAFYTLLGSVVLMMLAMASASSAQAGQFTTGGNSLAGQAGAAASGMLGAMVLSMVATVVAWFLSVRFLIAINTWFRAPGAIGVAKATLITGGLTVGLPFLAVVFGPMGAVVGVFGLMAMPLALVLYIILLFNTRSTIARALNHEYMPGTYGGQFAVADYPQDIGMQDFPPPPPGAQP